MLTKIFRIKSIYVFCTLGLFILSPANLCFTKAFTATDNIPESKPIEVKVALQIDHFTPTFYETVHCRGKGTPKDHNGRSLYQTERNWDAENGHWETRLWKFDWTKKNFQELNPMTMPSESSLYWSKAILTFLLGQNILIWSGIRSWRNLRIWTCYLWPMIGRNILTSYSKKWWMNRRLNLKFNMLLFCEQFGRKSSDPFHFQLLSIQARHERHRT